MQRKTERVVRLLRGEPLDAVGRGSRLDGYAGGFLTTRSHDGPSNRLVGADGFLRLDQSSSIGYHALLSDTRPKGEADSHSGHAVGVDYARETRKLVVNLMAADISTGFETDLGYLGRAGISRIGGDKVACAGYFENSVTCKLSLA